MRCGLHVAKIVQPIFCKDSANRRQNIKLAWTLCWDAAYLLQRYTIFCRELIALQYFFYKQVGKGVQGGGTEGSACACRTVGAKAQDEWSCWTPTKSGSSAMCAYLWWMGLKSNDRFGINCYFTISISVSKLSTLPYFTLDVDIWSKSFSAQAILPFSISRRSMLDIEPFVSATK